MHLIIMFENVILNSKRCLTFAYCSCSCQVDAVGSYAPYISILKKIYVILNTKCCLSTHIVLVIGRLCI